MPVRPAPNAFGLKRKQATNLSGTKDWKSMFRPALTKNMQATDLEDERFLCRRV
jgi:hypothetical protein